MLFRKFSFLACAGLLAAFSNQSAALAQCWPFNPMCCQPVRCCPPPVTAVTEMRECKQIVQRPVVETTYVDQPVTEYRQVVETKSAEVPTCTYQNVTEMRTVQRDCGQWVSQTHQRPMVTPCQYDSRPDLFGFMNRTGYAVRMAFTPQTWTERTYVPNTVAVQVPVTRQVAVRGTKTVNYQVAKMVPVTTTRRIAVNTVKMVSEEIVTKRPVIVYRPAGTGLAQGKSDNSPTKTASAAGVIQPTPAAKSTAINPKKSNEPTRITKRINEDLNDQTDSVNRGEGSGQKPAKDSANPSSEQGSLRVVPNDEDSDEVENELEYASRDLPVGQWVARWRNKPGAIDGPKFPEVAETSGKKKK